MSLTNREMAAYAMGQQMHMLLVENRINEDAIDASGVISKCYEKMNELMEEQVTRIGYVSYPDLMGPWELWLMKNYGFHNKRSRSFYNVVLRMAIEKYEKNPEKAWNPSEYELIEG